MLPGASRKPANENQAVPPKGVRNLAALRPRRSQSATRLSAVPGTGKRLCHSLGRGGLATGRGVV